MQPRHQKGYLFKSSGWWFVRYCDTAVTKATNLYSLGVSDKVIQGILRHAQVSTTMNLYVKGVPKEAVAAMELLQRTCSNLAVNQLSQETSKLVN